MVSNKISDMSVEDIKFIQSLLNRELNSRYERAKIGEDDGWMRSGIKTELDRIRRIQSAMSSQLTISSMEKW